MMRARKLLSVDVGLEAARRLIAGEDLDVLAREYNASTTELRDWRGRWERVVQREAAKQARQALTEATRERWVEEQVRVSLAARGYAVEKRERPTGPDVLARKDGRTLHVEVKGDRPGHVSTPATINVDVMTLLGEIVMAKAERTADDYALAVRPVHMRLLQRALPTLTELGVAVMLVADDGSITTVT